MALHDQPRRPAFRVLIVEDDRDAATSLAVLLGLHGHSAQVAGDGWAALAAFAADPPEVVLIDIGLPGGLDGWEVARRLRELPGGRGPALIALTGYGHDQDRHRSEAAGFTFHLVKPADPTLLLQLLRGYADRQERQEGGGKGPAAARDG
jgi:CheY-like chemotaxis protein